LLDETSILGLANGHGLGGLLPVPEIQYLAYLHNAEDQLRGEAAALQFFSTGAFRNPDGGPGGGAGLPGGLRRALPQRQLGGGAARHPGAGGGRAVGRGRGGVRCCAPASRQAEVDGSVCVFLEPIALYHTRDLHVPDDNGWLAPYAAPEDWNRDHITIGRARVYGEGQHLTIVTFGNGVRMSLRVAARLA
jgi:2-oxoisovalerate dehydrogenase E1 component